MTQLTPCKFTFDDTPAFNGFAHGSKWNGFDNIAVTREVLRDIVDYFENQNDYETARDLSRIDPMDNGLFSLGWGCTTTIVDDFSDVLKQLADCDGAILYWQTDKSRFKPALDAGVILEDGELLVHPRAICIEKGMAYTMPKTRYIVRDVATKGIDFLVWGDGDEAAAKVSLEQALADGLDVELVEMPADAMDDHTRKLIEG
jgi:hypothetical protein